MHCSHIWDPQLSKWPSQPKAWTLHAKTMQDYESLVSPKSSMHMQPREWTTSLSGLKALFTYFLWLLPNTQAREIQSCQSEISDCHVVHASRCRCCFCLHASCLLGMPGCKASTTSTNAGQEKYATLRRWPPSSSDSTVNTSRGSCKLARSNSHPIHLEHHLTNIRSIAMGHEPKVQLCIHESS